MRVLGQSNEIYVYCWRTYLGQIALRKQPQSPQSNQMEIKEIRVRRQVGCLVGGAGNKLGAQHVHA